MEEFIANGSITSVIDAYKPDKFFKDGEGKITIVYEGTIVATIFVHVNYSTYVISGNGPSLRRFVRLCNVDISNKGDYLMFNDSPAVVPKGLAASEVETYSSSLLFTPQRDPKEPTFKPFYDFDDMLDALDKVSEDPPGSPRAEPLLKTVYVLVSMHGDDKRNTLPRIDNKIHILPSGLCNTTTESPSEQLTRLDYFRGVPHALIEEKYHEESVHRIKALQTNVERAINVGKGTDALFHGLFPSQTSKRLRQYNELKLHVGPLLQDREYEDEKSSVAFTQCISILGSNWKEDVMKTPHGTFKADETLASQINDYYGKFHKPKITQEAAAEQLQRFQSLNLLNVEVLQKLTTSVVGSNVPLERFEGMVGEVDKLTISTDGTGIPHYTNVRLSHLLHLFKALGFDKVVIFDEGCRTGNMYKTSERASAEAEEALASGDRKLSRGESGGRRTRRRTRRRSRRFHKKS
jgi:hypothetical protein